MNEVRNAKIGADAAVEANGPAARETLIGKLVLLGLALCIVVLAVSGFGAVLLGRELAGLALMLHVTVGGAMAFLMAVAAVLWCAEASMAGGRFGPTARVTFWLMLVLALPVVLTIMLSMLPLLGPGGLATLDEIHKYSSLLLALVTMVHLASRRRRAAKAGCCCGH